MTSIESGSANQEPQSNKKIWRATAVAGLGLTGIITGGALASHADEVPCDPEMDVCVPGVTAPHDEEPVPGNVEEGEEIPVDSYFDDKGGNITTTTVPETTTTTTVPETTTTTVPETTTTTTVPETTTTVVTTTPPTLPPITVTVPVNPGHTL